MGKNYLKYIIMIKIITQPLIETADAAALNHLLCCFILQPRGSEGASLLAHLRWCTHPLWDSPTQWWCYWDTAQLLFLVGVYNYTWQETVCLHIWQNKYNLQKSKFTLILTLFFPRQQLVNYIHISCSPSWILQKTSNWFSL